MKKTDIRSLTTAELTNKLSELKSELFNLRFSLATGNLPLSTLRADIDYATASAFTNYGKLGVKVWIYKGEILGSKKEVKGGQD